MSSPERLSLSIVGAGAWGLALAQTFAQSGHHVTVITRTQAGADDLQATRRSDRLPVVALDSRLVFTASREALLNKDAVLIVTPAQGVMDEVLSWPSLLACPVLLCSKGIDRRTNRFLESLVAEALPQAQVGVLSGPSFAVDVAVGLPTAVTLALPSMVMASSLSASLSSSRLRLYSSDDVMGVAVGGAVKNVLAIAAGVVEGAGLGQSARAALIARGFAEMMRFGHVLGARVETLTGLSGLGDLVLTASSHQSRNYRFGLSIGQGVSVSSSDLCEGRYTAPVLVAMASAKGVSLPVAEAVASLVEGQLGVSDVVSALMSRPPKPETGDVVWPTG